MDIASVDVATRGGRGHVVADEAVRGGGAEACHYRRGHAAAVEDVAFVEVAAQTAASDVAASLWTRPSEGGGRFWGRNYERGHGTIAEVVASVDVAGWYDHGGCRVERTRLLDGCVATAASAIVSCACKLLQGSFCSAIAWSRSLFVFVDAAGSTADIQHLVAHQVQNDSGHARNSLPTFGLPLKGAILCHSKISKSNPASDSTQKIHDTVYKFRNLKKLFGAR